MPGLTRVEAAMHAGAAAAFTPANLPNIVHWWHAVNSPKIGSPGDISQLDDLVGAADLVQATGSAQPDDNGRTINGKVSLDFDGGDTLASTTDLSISASGTVYGFWIGQCDALVDADQLFYCGAGSAAVDGFNLRLDANDGNLGELQLSWCNGTTLESYNAATPVVGTAGPHLVEFWIIGTTGGVNFAIDGTNAAGGTNTVGYGAPTTAIAWFARAASLNMLDGAGCEWGICTAVASAGNRTSLLSYSQSYWGTP